MFVQTSIRWDVVSSALLMILGSKWRCHAEMVDFTIEKFETFEDDRHFLYGMVLVLIKSWLL